MNAVIVDGDAAYPPSSGKRLRTLNLMLRLARRHRITYIARCHDGPEAAKRAAEFLGDHGIEAVLVEHPLPRKRGPAFYARLAANLFSPLPYSVASHDSPPLRAAVQEHEARRPVDVWQFEWTPFLGLLRAARRRPRRVLMAHNVDVADLAALPRDGAAAAAALVRPRPVAEVRALRAADVPRRRIAS